jgi:hypothetical protein
MLDVLVRGDRTEPHDERPRTSAILILVSVLTSEHAAPRRFSAVAAVDAIRG